MQPKHSEIASSMASSLSAPPKASKEHLILSLADISNSLFVALRSATSQVGELQSSLQQLQTQVDTERAQALSVAAAPVTNSSSPLRASGLTSTSKPSGEAVPKSSHGLRASQIGNGFQFKRTTQRMDWRKLTNLNFSRLVGENDPQPLLDMFDQLTYSDLDRESVFHLTEGNLLKMVKACQLTMQYLHWQLDRMNRNQKRLEAGRLAVMDDIVDDLKSLDTGVTLTDLGAQLSGHSKTMDALVNTLGKMAPIGSHTTIEVDAILNVENN